jgi:hypothetical protein
MFRDVIRIFFFSDHEVRRREIRVEIGFLINLYFFSGLTLRVSFALRKVQQKKLHVTKNNS